jgi:CRP/FNR family cyclic AMP-dependent transcriptional regulator
MTKLVSSNDNMKSSDMQHSLMRNPHILKHIVDLNRVILDACVKVQHYLRNDIIFKQHDPADFLHIILDGAVLIYMSGNGNGVAHGNTSVAEKAAAHLVSFLKPGDLLGEMAFIDNSVRSATAEAIQPTTTLAMSKERFETIRANFPALAFELLVVELARRVRTGNVHAEILMTRKPQSRLARFLHDMAQHHHVIIEGEELVDLYVSKSRLDRLLGLSNTSVSKLMTAMEDEEKIIAGRARHRILIKDMRRLEEIAYQDE